MFSLQHFIWIGISVAVIAVSLVLLMRYKPSLKWLLTICCFGCVASELIKLFSSVMMVPSADGSLMYPYIRMEHVPFHLCSMQIALIFIARFGKDSPFKTSMLAFMYPSCLLGAIAALAMPSIFSDAVPATNCFAYPLTYQYFLYHAMLIVLGAYIYLSGEVDIRPKHYLTSLAWIGTFAFASLYLNSIFASPTFENGVLVSVDYIPNFLFTYRPPIDIKLTELWHWYIYLGILLVLVLGLIALAYIPVFKKHKKKA